VGQCRRCTAVERDINACVNTILNRLHLQDLSEVSMHVTNACCGNNQVLCGMLLRSM
jgi:hypothetical protein